MTIIQIIIIKIIQIIIIKIIQIIIITIKRIDRVKNKDNKILLRSYYRINHYLIKMKKIIN